jgi:hypothetical protein
MSTNHTHIIRGGPAIRSRIFAVLLCAFIAGVGSCGDDNPTAPPADVPEDLGAMPPVPKPASLTSEAQSETVSVVKPLRVVYAPLVQNVLADWRIENRACTESFWIVTCDGWNTTDFPGTWMADLPAQWGYRPATPFKLQLLDARGDKMQPADYRHVATDLAYRRCGFLGIDICWYDAVWTATPRPLDMQPYLCRDRFWMVAGRSQILPPGFSQEITTTVTRGVEKTECDEWAVAVTVEGQVQNGFASLKTAIEASYSSSVTKTVYEETSVETKYTPEPVPEGKQAVYQVWVLVDRYTITDRNRRPFTDPAYGFGACSRVHVQGVWEAHAITYFPATGTPVVASD